MKDYPLVILDWDYHTFDVVDEVGDVLAIYDEQAQNSEFIYVEGWLWCGSGYREKALYRKTENACEYKRHLTPLALDTATPSDNAAALHK